MNAHTAAEHIRDLDVPTYIYHLGKRIAVTPGQIAAWELPSRPTKSSDSRSKTFAGEFVELDAIEPDMLRGLVRAALEQHLPDDRLNVLKAAEESERELIARLVDGIGGAS